MVSSHNIFCWYSKKKSKIELADGNAMMAEGTGEVKFKDAAGNSVKLKCLRVPNLVTTLISLGRFLKQGYSLVQTNTETI